MHTIILAFNIMTADGYVVKIVEFIYHTLELRIIYGLEYTHMSKGASSFVSSLTILSRQTML